MPNEAILWVVIIIAALILIPVIGHAVRKADFKAQVSGKKQERKLKENDPALYKDNEEKEDYYKESLKNEAWQRSRQNFFGPK